MKIVIASALLALGFGISGYSISSGIKGWASHNRVVDVKGVSEREVEADKGFWLIKYTAYGEDLSSAQIRVEKYEKLVREFLRNYNLGPDNVVPQALEVNDVNSNMYGGDPSRVGKRSVLIAQTLLAFSDDPRKIEEASRNIQKLVAQGVGVSVGADYLGNPTYVFTKLNDYKPDMIAEAIRSAKEAAEKFAEESGTSLGAMKSGNQGVFSILPKDKFEGAEESKQIGKILRVVSSVSYYLD